MPHDLVLIEETKSWLARAATDIRAAEHDMAAQPPLFSDVVFHCQQAVEKAFKGFFDMERDIVPQDSQSGRSGGAVP